MGDQREVKGDSEAEPRTRIISGMGQGPEGSREKEKRWDRAPSLPPPVPPGTAQHSAAQHSAAHLTCDHGAQQENNTEPKHAQARCSSQQAPSLPSRTRVFVFNLTLSARHEARHAAPAVSRQRTLQSVRAMRHEAHRLRQGGVRIPRRGHGTHGCAGRGGARTPKK